MDLDTLTEAELVAHYLQNGCPEETAVILAAQYHGTFDGDVIEVSETDHAAIVADHETGGNP